MRFATNDQLKYELSEDHDDNITSIQAKGDNVYVVVDKKGLAIIKRKEKEYLTNIEWVDSIGNNKEQDEIFTFISVSNDLNAPRLMMSSNKYLYILNLDNETFSPVNK
jgi:hypothetical protein